MLNKIKKTIIPLVVFIVVFILHLLYFKVIQSTCADTGWLEKYIQDKEYYLGISYALSFTFIAFAFLKFKENRKNALKAAISGGLFAVILWLFCFLFGCCGSPMLIMYLNIIGISNLKVPKLVLLLMTVIFIIIGYIWLIKKSSKNCCDGKSCSEDNK